MRKKMYRKAVIFVGILMVTSIGYAQEKDPGTQTQGSEYEYQNQRGWNYCPYCGNYIGPEERAGGMHHRGHMGQQDPHHGYRYHQYRESQGPVEKEDVKKLMKDYLESTQNPNLKLGKIEDKGDVYEAEIVTQEGSLVDKILVYKRTGRMRSIY